MTLDEIQSRVQYIEAIKGDDESAHSQEDDLHETFIEYLADNYHGEIADMANEILKTRKINFARWCA